MSAALPFFVITYLLSWIFFAAAGYALNRSSLSAGAPIAGILFLLGAIMPSLVALALTARNGGHAEVRALLGGIRKWRIGARWYVFAVSYMIAVKLTAAVLNRLALGQWPRFGQVSWYLIVVAIAFSTPVQAGEEIGWRGYALPRLTNQLGLAGASIVLGVIWACWHLPFFFIPNSDNFGQSFPLYLLAVTAISVAMAWIFWRTKGSLLLTMLMHAAINNTAGIVTSATPAGITNPFYLNAPLVTWLVVTVLWIAAGFFLTQMRGARLDAGGNQPSRGVAILTNKLDLCIKNSL